MRSKIPIFFVYFTLWTGTEELGCLIRPGAMSVTSVLPPPLDQWEATREAVIGQAGSISRVLAILTNDVSRRVGD